MFLTNMRSTVKARAPRIVFKKKVTEQVTVNNHWMFEEGWNDGQHTQLSMGDGVLKRDYRAKR